jgi:hypothetical protein
MTTYNHSLSSAGGYLTGGMLSTDPDSTVSEVKSATTTFTSDLDDLGKPDTKAGEQAKDAVDELADSLGFYTDEMESDVRDATGLFDDPTGSVGITLELMVDEVSNTFKKIERLDANVELANAKSCARSATEITLTFTSKDCVVATVTNISGARIPGKAVGFAVWTPDGTQITEGFDRTNSAGQATHCSDSSAVDFIDAFVDTDHNGYEDAGDPQQSVRCPASRRCGHG